MTADQLNSIFVLISEYLDLVKMIIGKFENFKMRLGTLLIIGTFVFLLYIREVYLCVCC